jgi:hypothetical protein
LVDLGSYGRITLEWLLKKYNGGCGLKSPGSGYGQMVTICEHSNGPSSSIYCLKYIE